MGRGRHLIKWLYVGIRTHAALELTALRNTWAEDIGRDISDKEWSGLLAYPKSVSRNAKFKFIQTMVFHRAYLALNRLKRMFPYTQHHCPRCQSEEADLIHMLCVCPRIREYWNSVRQYRSSATQREIGNTVEDCILGLYKR